MKIAIDVADLDCERIDGTRVYIQNVLKHLGGSSPEDEFFLLHKSEYNKLLKPAKFKNYKDKSIGKGFWWTQWKFARAVRKLQPKVCWMPIQQIPFLPFGRSKKTKYVVTIHDLAFKFFPRHFPLIDRLKLNLYTDLAVKKADKIIAISETTRQDLVRLYPGIDERKIEVIYHGFDRENFQQKFSKEERVNFLNKWNLVEKNYLLYVGAIQPRKDLITLIKAFEALKHSNSKECSDLKLVLVGEVAWKSESTVKAAKNSKFKEDIIMTGKVNFKELAMFFRQAKIFVFPSLYEGFGIPLLEAMASKTPVITANNSSLGEVGGKAVLKFKSGNEKELAQQIKKLLSNKNLEQEMIEMGLKRIEKFSWEKCAKKTLRVLKCKNVN
jgi:glycosyltransferase involved in cell wall biosynthesis